MSKFLDSNGVLYLWSRITNLVTNSTSDKVVKVDGKGLSANDLTNILKANYDAAYTHSQAAHAPNNAEENTISTIKVNGSDISPVSKVVDITVPTKTSQLTNNSNFVVDASYVHTDNNYTNTEKQKVEALTNNGGGDPNIIEEVRVNGVALVPESKSVNVVVPTKTSQLTNDSDFVTDASYVHTENNYSSTEKTKLNGIASGAEVNVITGIKVNGVAQAPDAKIISLTVPTKTSQLTNDSNFVVDSAYVHTENSYTTTDKNKLAGIAAGAEVNIITGIKVNGASQTPTSKVVDIAVPTKTSQLTNDSNFLTTHQDISNLAPKATTLVGYGIGDAYTKTEVDALISSTYIASGSSTFATLPTPGAAYKGRVYNVTDAFTTTDSFVEGAGKSYPAGSNVVIVLRDASYMYDVLQGFVDLSGYVTSSDTLSNSDIDAIIGSV